MYAVLFFAQVPSHWNERFDAQNSTRVLIILGELAEDGQQFLDHVLLLQLGGENAKSSGTNTTNHGCIFLTELHKLFAEALFLRIGASIGMLEKGTSRDAAGEPFASSQTDH